MKKSSKIERLVASNTLNANRNIMRQMEEEGDTRRLLYLILLEECEWIMKRFPSLR